MNIERFADRTAVRASRLFAADHGYGWAEKQRRGGPAIIDGLPITEIHDYCRDAAHDVLTEQGLDPDEYLLDLTDLALNALGV